MSPFQRTGTSSAFADHDVGVNLYPGIELHGIRQNLSFQVFRHHDVAGFLARQWKACEARFLRQMSVRPTHGTLAL